MISHQQALQALRTKLLTYPTIVTTGSTTLAATATGYSRASGSFLTDGFVPGMEVAPSGFTQTTASTVIGVTALTMMINGGRTVEMSGAGKTLTVGLPAQRSWENVTFTPAEKVPYVTEQYVPGPMTKVTVGALGQLEVLPMYVIHFYVPAGYDMSAGAAYADTLLTLFAPETSLTLANASFYVRGDVAPYRGQALNAVPGWSVVPVNIPMRLRTANSV